MSQIETNPLVNPTIVQTNPNQLISTLPAVQVSDFSDYNPLSRHVSSFSIPQTNWIAIAETEKYYDNFTWTTTSTGSLKILEFTWANLQKLMPIGLDVNSYVNLDTILVTIKKTDNPFYQGSLVIAYDPTPTDNYYETFHNFSLSMNHIWQFQKVFLSPKTSGDIILKIPLNFPFEFLKHGSVSALETYLRNYSFGRIRMYVMDPLATMSPVTSLKFSVRAQLCNASTSGLKFST